MSERSLAMDLPTFIPFHRWIDYYKPEMEGGSIRDIGFDDPRLKTHPQHIWTRIAVDDCCSKFPSCDCDDELSADIFSGIYRVNRLEYYYTRRKWKHDFYSVG